MTMHPLFLAIRDSPSTYLPEPSLVAFRSFLGGYLERSAMEGSHLDLGYDRHEFHRWVCERFEQKYARAIAETTLAHRVVFPKRMRSGSILIFLKRSSKQALAQAHRRASKRTRKRFFRL